MKLLFDFLPILLFFITYKLYGIIAATIVMIISTTIQITVFWLKNKRFEKIHVITLILLIIFGGMTILFRTPEFLMWKVTVVNIVFAFIFFISFFAKRTLIEVMMGKHVSLPKIKWRNLNFIWGNLFIVIAILNTYFAKKAIAARDVFFANSNMDKSLELNQINCHTTSFIELCNFAQLTESNWVNFKLFGTMGITILGVIFTAIYIHKYVKEEHIEKDGSL